jgi:hypothetical protein
MRNLPPHWNALALMVALAMMLGCQGLSTSKSNSQNTQSPSPAVLSATPASVSFGNLQIGTNQTLSDTLTNTGGTSLTITQGNVTGTGFSISGLDFPVTLAPNQSTTFSVIFAPQSSGNFSGSIAIASNASDPSLSVTLGGSATAQSQGPGALSVSPVNVGSVIVGTNGAQTGTLSAAGASVSVSAVGLSGTNPSEFSIGGVSFPVTVTTSQPVTFTVTFTPGATGTASAAASFVSNASNSPSAAALTGTGAAAPVHTVSLSWTASTTSGVTSYNVYRAVLGTSSCGSYSNIGSTASSSTVFTDTVVADGTTYCYATAALDASGESEYSNIVQAGIPAP